MNPCLDILKLPYKKLYLFTIGFLWIWMDSFWSPCPVGMFLWLFGLIVFFPDFIILAEILSFGKIFRLLSFIEINLTFCLFKNAGAYTTFGRNCRPLSIFQFQRDGKFAYVKYLSRKLRVTFSERVKSAFFRKFKNNVRNNHNH